MRRDEFSAVIAQLPLLPFESWMSEKENPDKKNFWLKIVWPFLYGQYYFATQISNVLLDTISCSAIVMNEEST